MTDAFARGWGDPGTPGTASAVVYRKAHIVTINVGGIQLSVRREVAPLFAAFIHAITTRGYNLSARADDWGYICRYIRGYETQQILSNHAWGLAVDLNAITNPMTSDGVVHTDMPMWVIEEAIDVGLSWGGFYTGRRKDAMHFEFLGTPKDADRLVRSLTTTEDDMFTDQDRELLHAIKEWIDKMESGAPTVGVEPLTTSTSFAHRNTKKIAAKLGITDAE